MEAILYEVAILTSHTQATEPTPGLSSHHDPLLSQANNFGNAYFGPVNQCPDYSYQNYSTNWQTQSAPAALSYGHPMLLEGSSTGNDSEDLSNLTELTTADIFLPATDFSSVLTDIGMECESGSTENLDHFVTCPEESFAEALAESLLQIEENSEDNSEVGSDWNFQSDSEAYFSTNSQAEDFGSCLESIASSSGHSSRSSSIGYASIASRSRSSSIGSAKNAPLNHCNIDASEENFADVESLETRSMPFSTKRKKQLRMRKRKQELGTIFSPSVKGSYREIPTARFSERSSQESDSSEQLSGRACKSSSESVYPTSSNTTESSSGNTTSSSLNPLCSPFVPRSKFNTTYTSQTDTDFADEKPVRRNKTLDDSGIANGTVVTTDHSILNNNVGAQTENESAFFTDMNATKDENNGPKIQIENTLTVKSNKWPVECCEDTTENSKKVLKQNNETSVESRSNGPASKSTENSVDNKKEQSNFECKVKHGAEEFQTLQGFSVNDLPADYQNFSTWKTITTMSQRVVKISVKKAPSKLTSNISSNGVNSEATDVHSIHYGTGFAHYVGRDFVEIRTHSMLISSKEDAGLASVTFTLIKPTGSSIEVELKGEENGFHYNKYDQSSIFRCKSTSVILENLDIFSNVPIHSEQSCFQDSDYYSDWSGESISNSSQNRLESNSGSSSHRTSLLMECDSFDIEELQCRETVKNVIGSLECFDDRFEVLENSKSNNTTGSSDSSNQTFTGQWCATGAAHTGAAFDFQHVQNPIQYNISRLSEIQNEMSPMSSPASSPRPRVLSLASPALETSGQDCPSPLRVMEKRRRKNSPDVCPYRQESPFQSFGEYTAFSSYASDVIMESMPEVTSVTNPLTNLSPYGHLENYPGWEMAGLLMAQSHQKEAYNYLYNTGTTQTSTEPSYSNLDYNSPSLPTYTGRQSRSDFNNGQTPSQAGYPGYQQEDWDLNLINMDKNLTPLPPYNPCSSSLYYEDPVFFTDQNNQCRCCTGGPKRDSHAVIVSYPHGGQKAVSFGEFSAHRHTGGELYDTPTCMGSCGAPIISVDKSGGGAYVSNLVHAGSCRVNGVYSGIGAAAFVDGFSMNNQMYEIGK